MSGTPNAAQVLGLSNAVAAAFRTRFGPQMVVTWHSTNQRTVLFRDADTEIGVDGADTGSGTAAGSTFAPQACYLINWSIVGTYRGGHPRTYLSGTNDSDCLGDGSIASSRQTGLTTAAGNFLGDVNALAPSGFTDVKLGTFRFFRHHSAVDPPVFEPFLGGACAPLIATQRRRVGR
jgi:hypothetical protein